MADTTPTLREAAQQALEALVHMTGVLNAAGWATGHADAAVKALRAALAEQAAEQAEPVAYMTEYFSPDAGPQYEIYKADDMGWRDKAHYTPLYSAPPAPARQEPLFLLHTGQIDSGGEQDEWDIEANSWVSVEEFCRAHPGQTIGLNPQPLPAAPITAAPAEGGA